MSRERRIRVSISLVDEDSLNSKFFSQSLKTSVGLSEAKQFVLETAEAFNRRLTKQIWEENLA